MFDEKTSKGEVYRNEDKIKRKIRANNCENLYNFRTPHKNEAVWTKKILKFTKIVTVLLLFPWFAALFYLFASNTIHVMENSTDSASICTPEATRLSPSKTGVTR